MAIALRKPMIAGLICYSTTVTRPAPSLRLVLGQYESPFI